MARAGRWQHMSRTPVLFQLHWLNSCAVYVPHHLQNVAFSLPCAAWSCPCISHWVAGPLPTISGTKIRSAAASPRPPDQAAHLWGQELCVCCSKAVEQSAVQNPGSCQPACMGAFKKVIKTYLFGLAYSHLLEISDSEYLRPSPLNLCTALWTVIGWI